MLLGNSFIGFRYPCTMGRKGNVRKQRAQFQWLLEHEKKTEAERKERLLKRKEARSACAPTSKPGTAPSCQEVTRAALKVKKVRGIDKKTARRVRRRQQGSDAMDCS